MPGRIYATEKLIPALKMDNSLRQVMNVAHLPGYRRLLTGDAGYPLGLWFSHRRGRRSQHRGRSDFSGRCWLRYQLRRSPRQDQFGLRRCRKRLERIVDRFFSLIPCRRRLRRRDPKLSRQDEKRLLRDGAGWAVNQAMGARRSLLHGRGRTVSDGGRGSAQRPRFRARP